MKADAQRLLFCVLYSPKYCVILEEKPPGGKQMHTGKDRVLRAFAREKADRLPVFDVVNKPDMYVHLLGGE